MATHKFNSQKRIDPKSVLFKEWPNEGAIFGARMRNCQFSRFFFVCCPYVLFGLIGGSRFYVLLTFRLLHTVRVKKKLHDSKEFACYLRAKIPNNGGDQAKFFEAFFESFCIFKLQTPTL
jgi:hypothetical protein